MGTSRTSNKDVLEALNAGFDRLITALSADAIAAPSVPAAANVAAPAVGETEVAVDEAYLAHMTAKAADHATNKGSTVVLYARRNKAGETKLAYALKERFDTVVIKQPSCLGPMGSFKA